MSDKQYKYVVNNKLKWAGDIDQVQKGVIRVNPKKGDLLNTIIHEEVHRKQPKLTEKQVTKKANAEEKKLTINKAIKLLGKFKPPKNINKNESMGYGNVEIQ